MPNLYEISISSHFARARSARCERMNVVLGGNWGNIICLTMQEDGLAWHCVTDTGLLVVLSKDQKVIVTCYLATFSRAKRVFDSAGAHMPKALQKRISKNSERYFKLYHEQF